MGYKELVLDELHYGLFTVGELVKRLDDPVHLNSRTVSTYAKRLMKEGLVTAVLDRGTKKFIASDLYIYKFIKRKLHLWKDNPKFHEFITRFALDLLKLKGDGYLEELDQELVDAIKKIPDINKNSKLYI